MRAQRQGALESATTSQGLTRLANQPTRTTRYVTYSTSVRTLNEAFVRVETASEHGAWGEAGQELLDLAEGETANSVGVLNALLSDQPGDAEDDPSLRETSLEPELSSFSTDLVQRWKGALFSLNPANPDAARHFCTSAREILTLMLQTAAPDSVVLAADSACDTTNQGTPSRRSKVRFLLSRKQVTARASKTSSRLTSTNVIELFKTFNDGTHGAAGKYTVPQLAAIKARVEAAIKFLHMIIH